MGVTTRTYKNAAGSTGTRLAVENGSQQDAGGVALFAADGTLLIGQKTKANSLPVTLPSDWTTELGTTAQVTLQNNATSIGAGAAAAAGGYATAVFNVRGLPGATINFEVTDDGTNWDSLSTTQVGSGAIGNTTTANGYYRATIAGLSTANGAVRARISGYSSGTITIVVTLSTVVAANKYMALLQLPAALGPQAASGSLSVVPATGGTPTDRSSTIATGGTAQQLAASNGSRRYLLVQNQSTGNLYIRFTGAAAQDQTSLRIAAGDYWESPPHYCPTSAVSIIGPTTGQAFHSVEA